MKRPNRYFGSIFFLFSILLFTSCQKEEKEIVEEQGHKIERNYSRSNINFDAFKVEFLEKHENELSDHFSPTQNKGGDDYIVSVTTDRIVEFTSDSVTTYTMNVVTLDQDYNSFTNIVYFEKNNLVGEVILKYTPSLDWVSELARGNKQPFSGDLSIMSSKGDVIQSDKIIDGIPQSRTSPCIFGASPIWIDCYGASCPCPDGNGYLGGWDFSMSCAPSGSGGGGTGGDPGGGGNGGTWGGDLPTDPLEWNVFMGLTGLRGDNDSFIFNDPNINQYNSIPQFETFEDFENYMNNQVTDIYTVITPQLNGTHNTRTTVELGAFVDLEILINQTLETNNNNYQLNSLLAIYTGLVFGTSWNLEGFNYDVNDNEVVINVYGNISYNLFLSDIGILYNEYVHVQIYLNTFTGAENYVIKVD